MAELVVNIPERFKVDMFEMKKSVEEFVKLKLMRDFMLTRLERLLKDSKLTEEEALELGRLVKKGRFEKLKQMGFV